jgi:hypothetical protein
MVISLRIRWERSLQEYSMWKTEKLLQSCSHLACESQNRSDEVLSALLIASSRAFTFVHPVASSRSHAPVGHSLGRLFRTLRDQGCDKIGGEKLF